MQQITEAKTYEVNTLEKLRKDNLTLIVQEFNTPLLIQHWIEHLDRK